MEQNLINYEKIVVDHYESLMNDVDLYYENLKQGEFKSEREEITKKIKEYREKNLNQLNNVKIDEEKFDKLFPFEKRELLDRLIFKDECVSSIVSSDFKKIFIIYPFYLSRGAKKSLRKMLFESNQDFYIDLNTRDAIIVSLIINIYKTTKSSIIEIGNFECENLSIWSEEDHFLVNDLAEFMKKFKIKSNNLILNSTFMTSFPDQILSEDLNSLKKLQINDSQIRFLNDNLFSNLKDLEILVINHCYTYVINDGFLNGLIKLRELRIRLQIISSLTSEIEFPYNLRPEQFKDLKNLQILEITNANINVINDSTFINLNNLVHLDLSKNHLLEILEKTFEGLKNLKSLNLENNKIFSIYDKAFKDSRNLEKINLRNNKIEFLFADTFDGLASLKYLNIEGNLLHPDNYFHINGCIINV